MLATEAEALTVTFPARSTTSTDDELSSGPSDDSARSAACWPVAKVPLLALASWAPRLAAATTMLRA